MSKLVAVVLKADPLIGTGHLMRIKALLPYLAPYRFMLFCDSLDEKLRALCQEYEKIVLADKKILVKKILEVCPDLVLIDHYFLNKDFEEPLYQHAVVAVIDDLANRAHMCHLLFDQRHEPHDDYQNLVPKDCKVYLGDDYNLVKEEFFNLKKVSSAASPHPKVLISFGGSDPVHGCKICLDTILKHRIFENYAFTVLAGLSNHDYGEMVRAAQDNGHITILRHTEDVAALFSKTDIAIGACGGMFKERICAAIPSLNVEIADNQHGVIDSMVHKYHLGIGLSINELKNGQKLKASLDTLYDKRVYYAQNCRNLYAHSGLPRIGAIIKAYLEKRN